MFKETLQIIALRITQKMRTSEVLRKQLAEIKSYAKPPKQVSCTGCRNACLKPLTNRGLSSSPAVTMTFPSVPTHSPINTTTSPHPPMHCISPPPPPLPPSPPQVVQIILCTFLLLGYPGIDRYLTKDLTVPVDTRALWAFLRKGISLEKPSPKYLPPCMSRLAEVRSGSTLACLHALDGSDWEGSAMLGWIGWRQSAR